MNEGVFLAFVGGIEPSAARLGVIRDFENDIKTVDFRQISYVLSRLAQVKTPNALCFIK